MIKEYIKRAKFIPWVLCSIVINDIDRVAPAYSTSSSQAYNNSILSILDEYQGAPNIKIFATTRHIGHIDAELLTKLEI